MERFKQAGLQWELQNREHLTAFLAWAADNLIPQYLTCGAPPRHPAERMEYWQEFVSHHPNLVVVPRSHHLPWIIGADLLVHTSCTTGLEAAFLDRPTLNIEDTVDPFGERITTKVNHTVKSAGDAIATAQAFLATKSGPLAVTGAYDIVLEEFLSRLLRSGGAAQKIGRVCLDL